MKIFIGADHRGFKLKSALISYLTKKSHEVIDVGAYRENPPCDYPLISEKVSKSVLAHKNSLGILACMTGIGHSIAANKIRGIRAALCYTKKAANFARAHNDANVLVTGALFVKPAEIFKITDAFLKSKFEGGRHARRVNQIKKIESRFCEK